MNDTSFDCLGYLSKDFAQALTRIPVEPSLVLQVVVPGRPECRAHFTLGGAQVVAATGFAEAADVTLSIQAPELEQLARGALDLDEAMTLERLRFFGARAKLDALTDALRHLSSPLQSTR